MTKVSSRLYSLFRTAENDLTSFLIGVLSNALLILAGVTAVLEYWWRPINCHAPATFTDAAWKYAESYCYNSRWSFLPLESLEKHGETGADLESRWVKDDRAWIPVLLLAHAMILRLPHFIWILLSKCSSVNLGSLIKAAEAYSSLDATGRQSAVKTAADYLNSRFCLRFPEGRMSKWATMRDYWQCVKHPFPSGILALAAVLTKLIYGIATSATFLKLCNFMRVENGSDFGWREVNAFYAGSEREDLRILPKVVLCDYEVRQLGNIHRYTIQCTLPLNHFYTFLLIVLWFAYYFAQGFCWLSFAHTALTTLLPWPQKWFIVRALHRRRALVPPVDSVYFQTGALTSGYQATRHSSSTVPTSQQVASPLELRLFVESYIRTDGCFLLKHVSQHNDLFVYELINQLWQQFSTPPVSLPSVYDHSVDQSPATRHKYFVDQRAPASVETARKIVPAPVAMAATPATMNQQTAVSSALHKEGGKDHHAKMLEETHDERPLLGHQNEHGRHWEHVETTK